MVAPGTMGVGGGIGLHLFHLLGVVPFFFYIALVRSNMPQVVFYILIALGSILIIYHSYKGIKKYLAGSNYWWVNLIHALIIGPLLIAIGILEKNTPRAIYEALLLVTFSALGYHLKLLAEDVAAPLPRP